MTVKEKAYAKINLFLDVTARRDDGFHEISTLMQSVSLHDDIVLSATPSDSRNIRITSNDPTLEANENNLIYKAALKYLSYFNISADITVKLVKRIPIGAGLGGGSSDAAATLRAMNTIFRIATTDQLLDMGAELGSDVPFCICGGTAFCTGRGEQVFPIKCDFYRNIVISIGESRVSTPKAYALLDDKYNNFVGYIPKSNLADISSFPRFNIFESVIDSEEILNIKRIMTDNGANVTLMSGSGPSVFGGFGSIFSAENARKSLIEKGFLAYRCRLI